MQQIEAHTSHPAPAPQRAAKRPTKMHTCPECQVRFRAAADAVFCCAKHKDAYHNRNAKRGKVAMPLLMAWRGARHLPKWKTAPDGEKVPSDRADLSRFAFRELCALADHWNAEDREAGRVPSWDYIRPKMRAGWKAIDL